jgi:tetratricopeptide (TPR) repeat protein
LTAALWSGDRSTASGPIRVLQARAEEEYRAGNLEKAEELLLEATHLPECPPAIWSNLGQVRMDCKNYRTAADAYSHAIHGFSHDVERQAEALWCRGLAYDRQGLVTRARTDYTAALHLSPNHVDVLVNIGTLELDDGRPKTARRYLARAAAVDAKANWRLADIHIERGQAKQARRLLQLAFNAGETRALLDLAYLAQQDGDKTAAKQLLMRAIDLDVPGAEEQLTELT